MGDRVTVEYPAADRHMPAYLRYAAQSEPQHAYLELTSANVARIEVVRGEIASGMPMDQFHGLLRFWSVSPLLSRDECVALLDEALPLLRRVLAGMTVEHDGNNTRGTLNEDAQDACGDLDDLCSDARPTWSVCEPNEWFVTTGTRRFATSGSCPACPGTPFPT